MVKNPLAMQETQLQFLGWEDPLEKGLAIHSSILAWRTPWTEEPGVEKSQTRLSNRQFFTIFQINYYMANVTHSADITVIRGLLHLLGQEVMEKVITLLELMILDLEKGPNPVYPV